MGITLGKTVHERIRERMVYFASDFRDGQTTLDERDENAAWTARYDLRVDVAHRAADLAVVFARVMIDALYLGEGAVEVDLRQDPGPEADTLPDTLRLAASEGVPPAAMRMTLQELNGQLKDVLLAMLLEAKDAGKNLNGKMFRIAQYVLDRTVIDTIRVYATYIRDNNVLDGIEDAFSGEEGGQEGGKGGGRFGGIDEYIEQGKAAIADVVKNVTKEVGQMNEKRDRARAAAEARAAKRAEQRKIAEEKRAEQRRKAQEKRVEQRKRDEEKRAERRKKEEEKRMEHRHMTEANDPRDVTHAETSHELESDKVKVKRKLKLKFRPGLARVFKMLMPRRILRRAQDEKARMVEFLIALRDFHDHLMMRIEEEI
jgi:hypothetical protein